MLVNNWPAACGPNRCRRSCVSARSQKSKLPLSIAPRSRDLLFFNGLGGFTPDGREYVDHACQPGSDTPAPWVNVLANPNFGTLVSESGGAYTWSETVTSSD